MTTNVAVLRKQIEKKRRLLDQAEGRRQQVLDSLRTEFGVETLEESKSLFSEMSRRADTLQKKLDKGVRSFQKRYQEVLSDED